MPPCLRRVLPDSMAEKQLQSSHVLFMPRGKQHFRRGLCMTYLKSRSKVSAQSPTRLSKITLFLTSVFIQKRINDGVYGSQLFSSVHSFTSFSHRCEEDTPVSNANCWFLSLSLAQT